MPRCNGCGTLAANDELKRNAGICNECFQAAMKEIARDIDSKR